MWREVGEVRGNKRGRSSGIRTEGIVDSSENEVSEGKLAREVGEWKGNKGRSSSGIREEEIVDVRENECTESWKVMRNGGRATRGRVGIDRKWC